MRYLLKFLPPTLDSVHWEKSVHSLWGGLETVAGTFPLESYRSYVAKEKRWILEAGPDHSVVRGANPVRLVGYWNEAQGNALGIVLLMHGWEGNSHGTDTLSIGSHLNRLGFHTMRLNFRDHGNTHIYNEGLFNGSLIEEMSMAAARVASIHKSLPFTIIGPSLGGNFAIRLAYRENSVPIPNLEAIIAVCPAMDPFAASVAIDRQALFRLYFCRAWKNSLEYKSRIFSRKLNLNHIRSLSSVVSITHALSAEYFGYDDTRAYYDTYTITPARLRSPRCPVKIISSRNDPIIEVEQFTHFRNIPGVSVDITDSGGHVGYLEFFPPRNSLPHRIEKVLMERLDA
jgi:predicted alpha/beta-fold hydrolase